MANPVGRPKGGPKLGGRDWVKGQSGNPKGRAKMPDHLKEVSKLSSEVISAMISNMSAMSKDELSDYLRDPSIPIVEATIGSIYVSAIKAGDYTKFSFLLDRMVGKVREELNVTSDRDQDLEEISKDKLVALVSGD